MKSAKKKKSTAKKTAAKRPATTRPSVRKTKPSPIAAPVKPAAVPATPSQKRTTAKSIPARKSADAPESKPVSVAKSPSAKKPVAAAKPAPAAGEGRPAAKSSVSVRKATPRTQAARKKTAKPSPAKPAATKVAATPESTPPPAPPPLDIPAILFEGDESPAPLFSGPGQRYMLAPLPPLPRATTAPTTARLPESYGTGRLLLTARDPHWLYAHWDLTREQQSRHNAQSRDGHLLLRIFKDHPGGAPCQEIHLEPESRSWFVHAGLGGTHYYGELGFFDRGGAWQTISKSSGTFTPPEAASEDDSARFETLPAGVKFEELVELVKTVVSENVPLMEALLQVRARAETANEVAGEAPQQPPLPPILVEALAWCTAIAAKGGQPTIEWTPEREHALAQIISMDTVRRVWMGSLEITELIRRQLPLGISSGEAPLFSQPGAAPGLGVSGGAAARAVSSPLGGVEQRRGFWFNVNAELVIYGATEPNATVTIGGRKIKLRPDGSFSYRFALPDGNYELPAVAIAADESESRSAQLRFCRETEYRGEVAAHPQDTALKAPRAENL